MEKSGNLEYGVLQEDFTMFHLTDTKKLIH